jgi:hypothetical protein
MGSEISLPFRPGNPYIIIRYTIYGPAYDVYDVPRKSAVYPVYLCNYTYTFYNIRLYGGASGACLTGRGLSGSGDALDMAL